MISKSPRRYAIVGTGALGGFYGARLQQAGLEVHFLLNRDYQHVQAQGLRIDSAWGDFVLPHVHAYNQVQQMPPCDVVMMALKTTQNHLLPDLLPPLLKPDSLVLVLQNGLNVEAEVAAIVGGNNAIAGAAGLRVVGGLCFLCANKVGPGHIHHLDYGKISLGTYGHNYQPQGITSTLEAVAADFELAGIPIQLTPDLLVARWQKLVWNIPFNGLSVILDATTQQLMANAATRHLANLLMQEVALGAQACVEHRTALHPGEKAIARAIPESFIQAMLEDTQRMKPYRTSMKLDYDARRPLEVETMFGNPLRMARQAGVDLPHINVLYQQLKFLDDRNRSAQH